MPKRELVKIGRITGAFRVFESGEAAVIVAGDKQSQGGAELVGVSGEAAAFAVESGHIATQVGIRAFDGVGLLFARCHIVTCPAFTFDGRPTPCKWKIHRCRTDALGAPEKTSCPPEVAWFPRYVL